MMATCTTAGLGIEGAALGGDGLTLAVGHGGGLEETDLARSGKGGAEAGADGGEVCDEAEAWGRFAEELADWTERELVNRTDGHGGFRLDEQTGKIRPTTRKSRLTRPVLIGHYRARGTEAIVGVHSTARVASEKSRKKKRSVSKSVAIDIDRHDDSVDPEATRRAALAWYARLVALGFRALLLDSNGHGGYHLYAIFDAPVPTPLAFAFARWLIRDWSDQGLDKAPEAFPKQRELDKDTPWGNWLRLPGRHHKREFYSRVWDGASWLRGEAAIRAILATTGGPRTLIPAEVVAQVEAEAAAERDRARKKRKKAKAGAAGSKKGTLARKIAETWRGGKGGSEDKPVRSAKSSSVPRAAVKRPHTPGRRSGNPREMAADMIRRYPITARGQRNAQMGRAVASLIRAGYGDQHIFEAMMLWFEHFQALRLTLTDRHNMEAGLASSIQVTRSDPAFAPVDGGRADHLERCLEIGLEDWQQDRLRGPVDPAENRRVRQEEGEERERRRQRHVIQHHSDQRTLMGSVFGDGLCRTPNELYVAEALILHATYERRRTGTPDVELTVARLIEIIGRRHGVALRQSQVDRELEKYASRRDGKGHRRPACRHELIFEVVKGKPHKPSVYRLTGLESLLPRDARRPVPPQSPRPAPEAPATPQDVALEALVSSVDVCAPEARDAPQAVLAA